MIPTLRERRRVYAKRVIATVAKHSPVDANPRHRLVAVALVSSGEVATIALEASNRRAAGLGAQTGRCD